MWHGTFQEKKWGEFRIKENEFRNSWISGTVIEEGEDKKSKGYNNFIFV
jgi:hypothetical protein